MPDALHILGGIVLAKIHGVVDPSRLPAGSSVVAAADYPESVTGQPLAWPRSKRDSLLAASDWTQAADAPLSSDNVAEAKAYRTALRNLPSSSSNAATVAWPVLPSFLAASVSDGVSS